MDEESKSSKPETDLIADMKKEDESEEILIFKDEQIGQTQLSKLSPEEKRDIEQSLDQVPTDPAERFRFSGNTPEYQTLLKNLSAQQKQSFQESILNSPELLKLGTLKREKLLSVQPEGKKITTK